MAMPSTSSTTRRTNSIRQPRKPAISTDQLADQLSTTLAISNAKRKQKASVLPSLSDEDLRLSAMRSVNSASQALSTVVQSGWKQSSTSTQLKPSLSLSNITASAASAAKHLAVLRDMRTNDVDVERAAASILTKLVALEMVGLDTSSCVIPLLNIRSASSKTRRAHWKNYNQGSVLYWMSLLQPLCLRNFIFYQHPSHPALRSTPYY
jgi:hypothetical protein